jgi:hypothetical protein
MFSEGILTCDPQPFRAIVTEIPPNNSWPPFLVFSTACANKIAPAHVPHAGFFFTKVRSGSKRPESLANNAIVVDSGKEGHS